MKKLDELALLNEAYNRALRTREDAEKDLKTILNDRELTTLREQVRALDALKTRRTVEEITSEGTENRLRLDELGRLLSTKEARLAALQSAHGSPEALGMKLAETSARCRELETKLATLVPLPPQYAGAEALQQLVIDFGQHEEKLQHLAERRQAQERSRLELDAKAPAESRESLLPQVVEKRQFFERQLAEAQSLGRISEKLEALLAEMDGGSGGVLESTILTYFTALTGGKYTHLHPAADGLPLSVQNGRPAVPAELLSAGTADLLALAVRLGMADHLLADRTGFLILDDPMVNLDPERQQRAVETLRLFSQKQQLIVLTCHPHHARQLGGHLVELGTEKVEV